MPIGAQPKKPVGVQFRLWAPEASTVAVSIYRRGRKLSLPMNSVGDGWFALETDEAAPGDLYQFLIGGMLEVPDPASRFNPHDVHGPSQVIDPCAFDWKDTEWQGRPWAEAVVYELHVGTFSPEGTFKGAKERLDYLVDLGVTAIELMPIADFPGSRNWGYDGVLPFAPDSSYGHPHDLKELVQSCHDRGLMILSDVVYNHFGPEGNYLHTYAPQFFTDRHTTPWGNAINFDGPGSRVVRDFFITNALYWLEEYHFDGLRIDAVHSIFDESRPHFLRELSETVRLGPGQRRHCHLILENNNNDAHYLAQHEDGPRGYTAQWNDDWHHAAHVLATGERDGYYSDYADKPAWYMGRCLAEGYAYQGETSIYHHNQPRGEKSTALPLTSFINFLQNHDQIGNRAFGERFNHLVSPDIQRAFSAVLLLSPSPPMLFMGEEFASDRPFLYFCDFKPELAAAVSKGRRHEFSEFSQFAAADMNRSIPDPVAEHTFLESKLDWGWLETSVGDQVFRHYRDLLKLRKRKIVPLLKCSCIARDFQTIEGCGLMVEWSVDKGAQLRLLANLGPGTLKYNMAYKGEVLYSVGKFPGPWSVVWLLEL